MDVFRVLNLEGNGWRSVSELRMTDDEKVVWAATFAAEFQYSRQVKTARIIADLAITSLRKEDV